MSQVCSQVALDNHFGARASCPARKMQARMPALQTRKIIKSWHLFGRLLDLLLEETVSNDSIVITGIFGRKCRQSCSRVRSVKSDLQTCSAAPNSGGNCTKMRVRNHCVPGCQANVVSAIHRPTSPLAEIAKRYRAVVQTRCNRHGIRKASQNNSTFNVLPPPQMHRQSLH